MKNGKLFLTLALTLPCLVSCGKEKKMYVTFHQELAEDVKVEFTSKTLQSEIEIQEPVITDKAGYNSAWEDYTIEGKTASFTVNALYSEITYYASFKAQGVLVENVPYTIKDITSDTAKLPADREPAVPSHPWVDPYWEDYALQLNNIVVNAKYDHLKEFKVKFMAQGIQIGAEITITRDDLDVEGKINPELIPQEVKDYAVTGKEVVWNFVISDPQDTIITANVSYHSYYIKFVDFDGNQFGELVPYTIENETWESINKPEAPILEGYDTSWNEATLTYSDTDIVVVTPKKTGKEFFVSFDGFEGTQSVHYGEPYVLDHKALALKKWFGENDILVPNVGKWNIIGNVTLHLQAVEGEEFVDAVPDFIDVSRSVNLSSVEIAEGEGIGGRNALKITIDQRHDFGLKINKDYLDDLFSDSNVKALSFIAKSSIHNNNFRHRTNATNVCYELNDLKYGLENYYKKFSFTREMYNNHNDATDFVIYGGQPDRANVEGSVVYIDSFIFYEDDVMNVGPTKLSFENGCVDTTGGNFNYYSVYKDGNTLKTDKFFILKASSVELTDLTHSTEKATDGISSLSFKKNTGYIALYMGAAFTAAVEASTSKKFAFDIYATVGINSNPTVKNLTDGKNNPFTNQGGKLEANKWTTFVLDQSMYTNSSDSGRFLIIQGSSGGTFYLDNFRIVTE